MFYIYIYTIYHLYYIFTPYTKKKERIRKKERTNVKMKIINNKT